MARKSRRHLETEAAITVLPPQYAAAIYVRLSIENSGKDDAGDSIANQISICREYLQEQADLELYDIYEDNGRKGTNFDRPEFNRLMDDIRAGKVNCVLVKDLSRFGRDYIEAGEYLEKIFPFMGVRFIAITDGYDSLTAVDSEGGLMVPLKNMINEAYAKDISRKIITSFRARQEKGEYLPAFAPYGYVKSKTNKYRYEIDPETAPYVRMIFEWKAAGISHNEICRRLNDMGAVTPARRKVELGIWHAEKYKHTVWHGRSILDMLQNPTYTGCIVYGRMPKSLYQGIKVHRAEPDEWRILPDMHEAIVSQELFDRVQEIFAENKEIMAQKMAATKEEREKYVNLFKGKIYCADCGKRMRFKKFKNTTTENPPYYTQYECGGFIDSGFTRCSPHSIGTQLLHRSVSAVILEQVHYALDLDTLVRRMKGSNEDQNLRELYTGRINYFARQRDKINEKRGSLFENYAAGILDESEYQYVKKKYDEEAADIEKRMTAASKKKAELDSVLSGSNEWMQAMRRADAADGLDQALVDDLIRSVRIFEGHRIEVELNYSEQRSVYEKILEALQKEADQNE